jgi:hypothetical protein
MDAEHGAPQNPEIGDERVVDHQVLPVRIRSTPRYGRFLWIGVIGGLLVAVVLTSVAGQTEPRGGPMSTGASGVLWVFAVYAAVAVAAGLLLMGLLALLLAGRSGRRTRPASAVHDTTLTHDLRGPANDDIPRWVLDADDLAPGDRTDRDGTTGDAPRRRPPA